MIPSGILLRVSTATTNQMFIWTCELSATRAGSTSGRETAVALSGFIAYSFLEAMRPGFGLIDLFQQTFTQGHTSRPNEVNGFSKFAHGTNVLVPFGVQFLRT